MKLKLALVFVATMALQLGAQAQSSTAPTAEQTALASKLVDFQRGPEMERMALQLTGGAVQPSIEKWGPRLEAMPKAKQDAAREKLNAELKSFGDDTRKLIEAQMNKSADTALRPAYIDRFSAQEMKDLIAVFESPVFKKYQKVAPELGNVWIKDVVENTRSAVHDKEVEFDKVAADIVGPAPAAPAASDAKKAPAKKN